MKTKPKLPTVAEQARQGVKDLDDWTKGKTKFRATLVGKDGSRSTSLVTRNELNAKIKASIEMKAIRADLKLSQPEFASLMRVAPATVKSWEIARRQVPATALALAQLAHDMPSVRRRLYATQP